MVETLGQQYNMSGRYQSLYYTRTLIAMLPGHQTQQKQKIIQYITKKVVIIYIHTLIILSDRTAIGAWVKCRGEMPSNYTTIIGAWVNYTVNYRGETHRYTVVVVV